MKTRVTPIAAMAILSIAMLTGCSFAPPAPSTVDGDDLANAAEDWLDDDEDVKYKVECDDDEEIDLVEDESADCVATDKDTDLEYDVEITISDVDGEDFEVEVDRDEDANNADEQDSDDEDSDDEDSDSDDEDSSDSVTVPGSDIAALAAEALESSLGFYADDMACDSDEVEIYEGNFEYCYFTDPSDETMYIVDVEIDSFDPDTGEYHITAEVLG